KIEDLKPDDISRVAEMIFTGNVNNAGNGKGRATVVMQGDRGSFGDVENVLKAYGLGNSSSSINDSRK
ncbi:hypothetical protein NE685_12835, partial [Cutibacterium acnes]|nr:hypothetical protein [Cutibacterium acnes]